MPPQDWPSRGGATPAALAFAKQQNAKAVQLPPNGVVFRLLWGDSSDGGPQVLLAADNEVGAPAGKTELPGQLRNEHDGSLRRRGRWT